MHRVFLSVLAAAAFASAAFAHRPVIIAHRGASGYLPEHTLESAAFAHATGVDFIEQDIVLSKDNVLVVLHDIHVDTTTDVATRFPGRQRSDGRFYVLDFTWEELRSLKVNERVDARTGKAVFPKRFPSRADDGAAFRLCRFEEQVALIEGLNRSTGRQIGLYPEIKAPAWHRSQGRDPGGLLIAALARRGYTKPSDPVIVQCFEPAELKRLRAETKTQLRFVQLLEEKSTREIDYVALRTPEGLREIARYAQGIGPHLNSIASAGPGDAKPVFSPLVRDAHAAGLQVHPYTFRADSLPRGVASIDELLAAMVDQGRIDGLFIDHPDLGVRFLANRKTR